MPRDERPAGCAKNPNRPNNTHGGGGCGPPSPKVGEVSLDEGMEQLLSFFGVSRPADITWAHAVNSKAYLQRVLDSDTQMLEGDIQFDRTAQRAFMAHPPRTDSDLTFREWIEGILAKRGRGAKLDFKSSEAIAPCLQVLRELKQSGRLPDEVPIWLNADILPGPGGRSCLPQCRAHTDGKTHVAAGCGPKFDAGEFIRQCNEWHAQHPCTVASLGFTTGQDPRGYTEEMCTQMLQTCRSCNCPVTVPMRVRLLITSLDRVLAQLPPAGLTLTVWNTKSEPVTPEERRLLRERLDLRICFFDLIDEEGNSVSIFS